MSDREAVDSTSHRGPLHVAWTKELQTLFDEWKTAEELSPSALRRSVSPSKHRPNTQHNGEKDQGTRARAVRHRHLDTSEKAKAAFMRKLGACSECRKRRIRCDRHYDLSEFEDYRTRNRQDANLQKGKESQVQGSTKTRSVCAQLCHDCIGFYRRFLRLLSNTDLVPKSTLTLLTRNYEALVLWAKAYDIVNGGLDQVLTSSRLIRRSYLKSLVSVSCTLLERLSPLYPVLDPLEATIPLRETLHRDGFKCLEDTYRDDDSVDISPSYSEDSIEDIVKDLEVDVDCLLDMDPLFSCPAVDRKEPLKELSIEPARTRAPYQPICDTIKIMFPGAGAQLVQRLGEATWQSFRRREPTEFSERKGPVEDLKEIAPTVASSVETKGTSDSIIQSSHNQTTAPPWTQEDPWLGSQPGTLPSFFTIDRPTALSVAQSSDSGYGTQPGESIRPYICPLKICSSMTVPFRTHREFFDHVVTTHGEISQDGEAGNHRCPLCWETIGHNGTHEVVKHLSAHLEEISFQSFKLRATSVIDLEDVENAQPTKQPKTVEFNEDVDPGSERVREQLLDQMERLARGIQESHLDPRDLKPLTEGLDKLQKHITSASFKSDDLVPAAKGLSTLGEALMASIKERDEKLHNMKKKEGKRKEQIEEVDSDLEIVSWRTIKPESPHTYDLNDLTARLKHLSSLIAEFKRARERLSEYERRVAEHGLEAGALADIIAEYSAFQAEQRLKGWRLQVGDNVAVRRRLEKILKKAREETERLLLHVPSASSAQKDVPSNDDNIDLEASRQRSAGDGDHASSSNSDGGPAKGLDKKFECPEKGCGKSYSRAEHLYRHQLNHNPKQLYKCDWGDCTRAFVRLDLCNRHKDRHTAKGSALSHSGSKDRESSDEQDTHQSGDNFLPPTWHYMALSTADLFPSTASVSSSSKMQQRHEWLAPDGHGNDIPPDAMWTCIERTLVSPEVLEEAGVRYEARPRFVAVLGVQTQQTVAEWMRESTEARSSRPAPPPYGMTEEKGFDAKIEAEEPTEVKEKCSLCDKQFTRFPDLLAHLFTHGEVHTAGAAKESEQVEKAPEKKGAKVETATKETTKGKNMEVESPVEFMDAAGRKHDLPFQMCKTWTGMKGMIGAIHAYDDDKYPHVALGHYDLMGPDGEIILPSVWESLVKPGWAITMHMWPLPESQMREGKSELSPPLLDQAAPAKPSNKRVLHSASRRPTLHLNTQSLFYGLPPVPRLEIEKVDAVGMLEDERRLSSSVPSGSFASPQTLPLQLGGEFDSSFGQGNLLPSPPQPNVSNVQPIQDGALRSFPETMKKHGAGSQKPRLKVNTKITEGGSVGPGILLPPPSSPSASTILFAGAASGPVHPLARPIPQQHQSMDNIDTPVSALPSRFMNDDFLPSPSSFFADWNHSNTLPSPLNFSTPNNAHGPSFLNEDTTLHKRKLPDADYNNASQHGRRTQPQPEPSSRDGERMKAPKEMPREPVAGWKAEESDRSIKDEAEKLHNMQKQEGLLAYLSGSRP